MLGSSLGFLILGIANKPQGSVLMSIAEVQNVANGNGISPLYIVDGYGDSGGGSKINPYTKQDWTGRIKTTDFLAGAPGWGYYIDINVDPRNTLFVDNIIIEYKFYLSTHYLSG